VSPFYTGNGGKGISIAILAPKVTGLTENQDYIPALVQGEFVSNFSGYSAISVLDRENLDEQYKELLSGYYDDNAEAGTDLGHLPPTEYIMGGKITKTAAGYALQMQITKTADKMTAASYSGNCTFVELDNLTGIRQASLNLLQEIGVELTDRAKTELAGAAAANHVNAQTALAQGITAQQDGTVVEALSHYYQAAAFDPSLLEAANRVSVISADISSGNIGVNVRNDIQRRKEWLKILEEAENYFKEHLPWEIVYNPTLTQGTIDYSRETVDMSFNVDVRPTDGWKIVQTLIDGLNATGKRKEWGFEWWPLSSQAFVTEQRSGFRDYGKPIILSCSLVNSNGKLLANETKSVVAGAVYEMIPWGDYNSAQYLINNARDDSYRKRAQKILAHKSVITDATPNEVAFNDAVVTTGTSTSIVFNRVNANDITDHMTVKIISVNGIDAETIAKTGYIRISTVGRL
jgi:hypothetical protein